MNPQDDPEARIREMERSLAEESGGYADALPPPVHPYGVSYPHSTEPIRTGFRAWWVIIGLVAFVIICAMAISTGMYFASRSGMTAGTPTTRPNVYGGGGSVTDGPTAPTRTVDAPTRTVTTAPQGGIVSISGVGGDREIACNDSVVNVSGVSNTIVISGHCVSLTVSGVENAVTVDSADVISASGFDNQVTFHFGTPRVENSGNSNVVEQG